MGAFGSCLGVGRPMKPNTNSRLHDPTLDAVGAHPYRPASGSAAGRQVMRAQPFIPGQFLSNGFGPQTSEINGKNGPMPKLLRQSSSLSGNHQQQQQLPMTHNHHSSPSQAVQSLVNVDELNTLLSVCSRSEIRVLLALHDYEPKNSQSDDLVFKKGDHLETVSKYMSSDWWVARSKSTKKVGYVPRNYVIELKPLVAEPWYLGKIGRNTAELQLKLPENKDGAFIIRDSDTTSHQYSLSLKHENDVKHYRIKEFEKGGFFINKNTLFSTIHDLVLHYSTDKSGLCINLREPCMYRSHEKLAAPSLPCDSWEVDRSRITLEHVLGKGQFGQVYQGLLDKKTKVAVKTLLKGMMDPMEFLAEAQIMKKMRHENLVQLHCVCSREEPVYIVTELMSRGALISYLQTDEGKNLLLSEYIRMATQIAAGMTYLERENYVHRDLAARNILVGDNNVCKIADFGLARFLKESEYEAKPGARFPIKWTAPEAANLSKFTIKSDVWSFGIVLYEIITKGGTPYADMSNAAVLTMIGNGYRMPKPPNCDNKYYNIMVECWNKEPTKRPTFEALHEDLKNYFNSNGHYREAIEFRER